MDVLPETRLGRRERKKLRTRALIQREALRLFLEKGFEATTIEEIAYREHCGSSTNRARHLFQIWVVTMADEHRSVLKKETRNQPTKRRQERSGS